MRKYILAILLISPFLRLEAQYYTNVQTEPDEKFAKLCIIFKDYPEGLAEYMRLIKNDSNNLTYRYHIGLCHLNMNIDKTQAIPWLEWTVKQPKCEINAWYELGRAYMYAYRFEEAISIFEKFKKLSGGKDENYIPADRQIQMCKNAMELMKKPVDVSFKNLGKDINSPYPDYNPYVTKDETMLLYNSQRVGNIGNYMGFDGYYTSDLYFSQFKNESWKKGRRFSPAINTILVEEIVGMSPDGSRLYLFFDNFIGQKDLFYSTKKGKGYDKPKPFGPGINTEKLETSATMTSDGQVLFFAAEWENGKGRKDIYMCKKLPSGEWSQPELINGTINTPWDEDFPYLSADGKTLYFASMGHNSMGDYDLFKTTWDRSKNTFTQPENLGYPVNSPEDNKTICFTESGRYAYLAATRKEGYGDLDIYRITFNNVRPTYTVVQGFIYGPDSVPAIELYKQKLKRIDSINSLTYAKAAKAFAKKDSLTGNKILNDIIKVDRQFRTKISATDLKTKENIGVFTNNPLTGKYTIILPPGDYSITFRTEDYKIYVIEKLSIPDRDNRSTIIKQDIKLESNEANPVHLPK